MTSDDTDDYGIGRPIDDDYCDVGDPQRADVSHNPDTSDDLDRQPPAESDRSFTFGTERGTLAGTRIDDLIDEEAVIANDGRSRTRTWFHPSDMDADRETVERYWRLMKLNDGVQSPDRDVQNKQADNNRWVDTICKRLDLSEYHTERVRHMIDETNLKHMATYTVEKVVLAAVTYVVREERIDRGADEWLSGDETFVQLCQAIDTDQYELRRIRQLLQDKCEAL